MTKMFQRMSPRTGAYFQTLQTGPANVFRQGGNQGKKRQTPSLPVLNLPPHVDDELLPCKNESPECAPDGSCLRCGACQGVACRPVPRSVR